MQVKRGMLAMLVAGQIMGTQITAMGAIPVWPEGTPEVAPPDAGVFCDQAIRRVEAEQRFELDESCLLTSGLTIPDGWTFDGQGHAIVLADPDGGRFQGGALVVVGGSATIMDVRVDGGGLTPGCADDEPLAAIAFVRAGGTVERVTIDRINRGEESRCGIGIVAADVADDVVTIRDSTIRDIGDAAIDVFAGSRAVVVNDLILGGQAVVGVRAREGGYVTIGPESIVANAVYTVSATGFGTSVTLDRSNIGGAMTALEVADGASADVSGAVIMRSMFGVTVDGGASVRIHDGSVLSELDGAVMATGPGGRVGITDTTFEYIWTIGVLSGDTIITVIQDSTFSDVGEHQWDGAVAIDLSAGGSAFISGNRFTNTSVAIALSGEGGRATVVGNAIEQGRYSGIRVVGSVEATLEDNSITSLETRELRDRALIVSESASAEVRNNRIANVTGRGDCLVEIDTTGVVVSAGNDLVAPVGMDLQCGQVMQYLR
jgi:hypothetical protein